MFAISYVTLWVLTTVLFVAVLLLYRHFGRQLQASQAQHAAQGPPMDEPVNVSLETIDGKTVTIGDGSHPYVVAFTAPGCPACIAVQPFLSGGATRVDTVHDVLLVHHGDVDSARAYAAGVPAALVIADPRRELSRLWNVPVTPYFVVTDKDGRIRRKGVGTSREQVNAYLS